MASRRTNDIRLVNVFRVKFAEYVWIDAFGKTRSKTKVFETPLLKSQIEVGTNSSNNTIVDNSATNIDNYPIWNYDGSSTGQANGDDSEVLLAPVRVFDDPFTPNGVLVLCECTDKDGTPIPTNTRCLAQNVFKNELVSSQNPWYGLEQEYVIYDQKTNRPIGWETTCDPAPQGPYYCAAGGNNTFGRDIAREHMFLCEKIGLTISGMNGEVMPGQWEYQIGPCEGIDSGDEMWISRYLLDRVCEKYGMYASLHPKPQKGDWNGSGCHANYSTLSMRNPNGLSHIMTAIEKLSAKHKEHIEVYGSNDERLTGKHETSSIDTFSCGVADRTASVRIPTQVERDGHGYFEDRRPASDCDPYLVTMKLAETTILE